MIDVSPATSHSARVSGHVSLDVSSCPGPIQKELAELRQQLRSMKKQTKLAPEQLRKSSDREQEALRQTKESFELREIATANTASSSRRKNASQDMAGMCFVFWYLLYVDVFISLSCCCLLSSLLGAFVDAAAEE
jgi:hypothetical protein